MTFEIVRNDITKMKVDVIVNAANSSLQMGGGVCGAIFSAAGADLLQDECDRIGHCEPGQAVMSGGYALPAKNIIHTVGPIWHGGNHGEAKILEDCYLNSMDLAHKHGHKSIAFPLISSGLYGYPKDEALQVAIASIGSYLLQHDLHVILVVYDQSSFVLSEKLFTSVEKYIDDHYIEEHPDRRRNNEMYSLHDSSEDLIFINTLENRNIFPSSTKPKRKLEDLINALDETFSQQLLRLIDEKGMHDVETYKKANVDRKLFSKIRSDKDYKPSKSTAIAFAIALELNLDETLDLMARAGYTLSRASKSDVIIEFFLANGFYNIFEINEVLFKYAQPLLGA